MALATEGLTMARVIYHHEVLAKAKPRGSVAERAQRAKEIGAPAPKRKRATPKTARAVPKVGPKPALVERIRILRTTRHLVGSLADLRVVDRWGETQYVPDQRLVSEQDEYVDGWKIRWDEVYPSQNVLMRKYANKHAYGRLLAKWEKIFQVARLEGKIPKAVGRRRLTVTRFVREAKYLLDRGNLVGGGKPFIDAAVRAGLLRGDREEDVDDQYRQAIDPDERVEITIEDI